VGLRHVYIEHIILNIYWAFEFLPSRHFSLPISILSRTPLARKLIEHSQNSQNGRINRPLGAQGPIFHQKTWLLAYLLASIFQSFFKGRKCENDIMYWFWPSQGTIFASIFHLISILSKPPSRDHFSRVKMPNYTKKSDFGPIFDFPGVPKSADAGWCLGVVRLNPHVAASPRACLRLLKVAFLHSPSALTPFALHSPLFVFLQIGLLSPL